MNSFFSPLVWTLQVLLALGEATGKASIRFEEFALHVQTSDPTCRINDVVNNILDLRKRRTQSTAKRRFDSDEYEKYGMNYDSKSKNFKEYGDVNLRYLRQTGIFARDGRGIAIRDECRSLAKMIVKTDYNKLSLLEKLNMLYNIPALPTDSVEGARLALNDMISVFKSRGISYDLAELDKDDAVALNHTRMTMQAILNRTNEEEYAAHQRSEWKEISAYMQLIISNKSKNEDIDIYIPQENKSAYLEWVVWRSLLAIDSLVNRAEDVRSFRIDQDMMPVNTAPGGRPDLLAEYADSVIVGEVTLSTSSMQEAMEGEPVRRHVADQVVATSKHVYGMFIAKSIDTNTAETFKRRLWYLPNDTPIWLTIVPLTVKQYNTVFCYLFENNMATPDKLLNILKNLSVLGEKGFTAPEWKKRIDNLIKTQLNRLLKLGCW